VCLENESSIDSNGESSSSYSINLQGSLVENFFSRSKKNSKVHVSEISEKVLRLSSFDEEAAISDRGTTSRKDGTARSNKNQHSILDPPKEFSSFSYEKSVLGNTVGNECCAQGPPTFDYEIAPSLGDDDSPQLKVTLQSCNTDLKLLQPRGQLHRPHVIKRGETMTRPKRVREQRPSAFFIPSPFRESRRVTEYAVVFRKRRLALGYSILLICVCLFLYEFSLANWTFAPPKLNPAIGPPSSALLRAGAKNTALILEGEWWRLIAPSFLHAGIIHLLFNMGGLLNLLYEMEPVHGWKPLLFIYVFAGVFSTGCSALFLPSQIMVGSSGAIFGLMGAQLSDVIHNWGVFYQPARKLMFLCTMTTINLMLGLMPFLDNFAHVSGTLMGILCGLILLNQKKVDRLGFHRPKRCYQIMASSFSVAMAIIFFVTIFALLFGRSNPYNFCPACLKMACVTFPPKAQSPWWDCSTCARVGFSVIEYVNGTFILECPFESNQIIGFSVPGSDQAQSFFLEYCKSKC